MTLAKTSQLLEIVNDGEIDINAILLIGASTKRDDKSKIGYFGSGLKYSMATLIRNNIPFKIFSGLNEIKITTKSVSLRGKEFRQIFINGEPTSMTLEMGIDWEPWFAVREVLCNAIDEGYYTMERVSKEKPEAGCTKIYIGIHESLQDMFDHWDRYFSEKRTDILLHSENSKIFTGEDELIIYRKGIRVHQEKSRCLFHYDMEWIDINESRVIKDNWDFKYYLVKWMAEHANEEIIKTLFAGNIETWEWKMDWNNYSNVFNDQWLKIINNRPLILADIAGRFEEFIPMGLVLPSSLCKSLKNFFKEKVRILGKTGDIDSGRTTIATNERQQAMIQESIEFLLKAGIMVRFPINVCCFELEGILGQAEEKEIFISEKVFEEGLRQVTLVIMEENFHLLSGFGDCSRKFEQYIIKDNLKLLEKLSGSYL